MVKADGTIPFVLGSKGDNRCAIFYFFGGVRFLEKGHTHTHVRLRLPPGADPEGRLGGSG